MTAPARQRSPEATVRLTIFSHTPTDEPVTRAHFGERAHPVRFSGLADRPAR